MVAHAFLDDSDKHVTSAVGKVTGNYYRILLDKEWGSFWRVTALAALIFAASTAVRSTQKFISEMLAIR